MNRGDVVLIVASGELGKPRPAVVVQTDELGDSTTSVIVCPMSTDVDAALILRPIIVPTGRNGIRSPSQIVTDKIVALARSRVRRTIGALNRADVDELDRTLLVVLGLARAIDFER